MKQEHNFEHAVFKCAALVENQADADRAKQICIDNDLPIWDREDAFECTDNDEDWYIFCSGDNHFYVDCIDDNYFTDNDLNPVSLSDFEKLAEDYSGGSYDSIEDILSVFKSFNNGKEATSNI
jgi:hypothetical protein